MKLDRTIALRYLVSKRKAGFVTAISFISITGVTVGVAALIVVLSVFNGFNGLVTSILVNFDPHIRLESLDRGDREAYSEVLAELGRDGRVRGVSPFVLGKALVVSKNVNRVINMKGVDPEKIDDVSGLRKTLVLGTLDFEGRSQNGVVVGLTLADRLGVVTGDTISVVSPEGSEPALLQIGQPMIRRFVVTGIYESNNKEYDAYYAYVGLSAAQALFEMGETITGVEVRLGDLDETNAVARDLVSAFGGRYRVLTWFDLHRELYSVMQIERWMAYIILCLIIGVASFNLLGSLTMSVIEKTRDIGILKALGSGRTMIQRVFMFQGLYVGVLGSAAGLLLGCILILLQQEFHLIALDPTVYIIPAIPVEIHFADLVLVPVTATVLCALAALYPSRRAATLVPVEAIRWE